MRLLLALLLLLATPALAGAQPPSASHLEALVAAGHKAMEEDKDLELAAALYAQAAAHPDATTELRAELAARQELIRRRTVWYAGLVTTGITVAFLLGGLLVLVSALLVVRKVQRRRLGKKSTSSFKIVDRRTESSDHAQVLAARFFSTLRGALEIEGRPDLIGRRGHAGDLVLPIQTSVSADLRALSDDIDKGQAIEVAGVRLSLRSLVRGLVDAIFPTRFSYSGELVQIGASINVYLSRFDRHARKTELWTARATGENAEEDALTQLAYRLGCTDVKHDALPSRNPDALYAYHRAVRAIDVASDIIGEKHERGGQLKEVRRYLEEALALDPRLHAARFRLAIVLRKMGDAGRALAVLDEMRRVDPRWRPYADYHRARVLLEKTDPASLDEAHRLLGGLKIDDPSVTPSFAAYVRSARVAVLSKKLSIAGIRLVAGDATVDADLARMNTEITELDGMRLDAADLTVARGLARYARAKLELALGDLGAAEEDARRAAVQLPRYSSVKAVLAAIVRLRKHGTWEDEAQHLLDEAAEIDPDDPMVLEERGAFLLATGRRAEAIEDFEAACDERASARFALGEALAADPATADRGLEQMISAVERHLTLVTSVELRRIAEAVEPTPALQRHFERAEAITRELIHGYKKAQAELAGAKHDRLVTELALLEKVREELTRRVRRAEALRESPAVPTEASDVTRVRV